MSVPVDVFQGSGLQGKIRNEVREYQYNAPVKAAGLRSSGLPNRPAWRKVIEIRGQDALKKRLRILSRPIRSRLI
jgi:hypothetical protein